MNVFTNTVWACKTHNIFVLMKIGEKKEWNENAIVASGETSQK